MMKQLPPKEEPLWGENESQITVLFRDRRLRRAPAWLRWCRRQPEGAVGCGIATIVCLCIGGVGWSSDEWSGELVGVLYFMGSGMAALGTTLSYFAKWLKTVEPPEPKDPDTHGR